MAGFAVMSPDGLLIRLVDSSPWTLTFWRCVLIGAALGGFVALRPRPGGGPSSRAIGGAGLAVAFFSAVGNLTFVLSMAYADVATTLLIVCTAPLFAAGLEPPGAEREGGRHTWAAIVVVLAGTGIILVGTGGGASLSGSLLAVAAALAAAAITTAIRRGRRSA